MKFLEKQVTLGDMEFKVRTNRDIAVKAFEEYPELIEYVLNKQGTDLDDDKFFINALKNKELGILLDMNGRIANLIEFALPLMLKEAGDETDAQSIVNYAKDNEADEFFNAKMLEFLVEGFTLRGQDKPKILFSMK